MRPTTRMAPSHAVPRRVSNHRDGFTLPSLTMGRGGGSAGAGLGAAALPRRKAATSAPGESLAAAAPRYGSGRGGRPAGLHLRAGADDFSDPTEADVRELTRNLRALKSPRDVSPTRDDATALARPCRSAGSAHALNDDSGSGSGVSPASGGAGSGAGSSCGGPDGSGAGSMKPPPRRSFEGFDVGVDTPSPPAGPRGGGLRRLSLPGRRKPGLSINTAQASSVPQAAYDTVSRLAADPSSACSSVTDYIRISGSSVAQNKSQLAALGITHILNCAGSSCPNYYPSAFTYCTLDLFDSDTQDVTNFAYVIIDFLESARRAGGNALVHCLKGVSRSVAAVCLYLMWRDKVPTSVALKRVKESRPQANPNSAFLIQLEAWDRVRSAAKTENASLAFELGVHSTVRVTMPLAVGPLFCLDNARFADDAEEEENEAVTKFDDDHDLHALMSGGLGSGAVSLGSGPVPGGSVAGGSSYSLMSGSNASSFMSDRSRLSSISRTMSIDSTVSRPPPASPAPGRGTSGRFSFSFDDDAIGADEPPAPGRRDSGFVRPAPLSLVREESKRPDSRRSATSADASRVLLVCEPAGRVFVWHPSRAGSSTLKLARKLARLVRFAEGLAGVEPVMVPCGSEPHDFWAAVAKAKSAAAVVTPRLLERRSADGV